MKKGSTLFLKLVIIAIGLLVLVLGGVVVPIQILQGDGAGIFYIFWAILYLTTIPFYIALYNGLKLLSFIDNNTAFSQASVSALNYIKYCALSISFLYLACLPLVFWAAEMDDAPGLILFWLAICGGPIVIAVFAALLQMLLQNILDMKAENDLTV
jgi:hypothetical protein